MEYKNWINGQLVGAREGGCLALPSKGESRNIALSGFMDVVLAVKSANDAKKSELLTQTNLIGLMRAISTSLTGNVNVIAERIAMFDGIPIHIVKSRQVPRAALAFSYAADLLQSDMIDDGIFGVIGILTSAYDTFTEVAIRIAAALSSGNAVILKPSSWSPQAAVEILNVVHTELQNTGLPAGLVNLVFGDHEAGSAVIEHPGIPYLFFSGEFESSLQVQRLAIQAGKKLHYLNCGKNHLIVNSMPSLEIIKGIADSCLCVHNLPVWRVSQIDIKESLQDEFLRNLVQALDSRSSEIGPLLRPGDSGQMQSLSESLGKGRRIWSLGKEHFAVIDMSFCSPEQNVASPGVFISINSFKYLHEAVNKMANSSPWGLIAYLIDEDVERISRTAARLEMSVVKSNGFFHDDANSWVTVNPRPLKKSGFLASGLEGMRKTFLKKTIHVV